MIILIWQANLPVSVVNVKLNNMDIKKIKPEEIQEIRDFLESMEEYGHIYHFPPERLDEPFNKILEGISEIRKLMKESFEI